MSTECGGGAAGSMVGDDLSESFGESFGGGGVLSALADADFGRDLSESYGMGSVAESFADSCGGLSPGGGGAQGAGGSHGGGLGGGRGGRREAVLGGGSLEGSLGMGGSFGGHEPPPSAVLGMGDDFSSYGANECPPSAVLGARPMLSRQQQQAAFQANLSRSKCAPVSARQPALKAPPPAAAGQGLSSPETSPLKLPTVAASGAGATAEAPAPHELPPPLLSDRDMASLVSSSPAMPARSGGDAHGDASRAAAPAPTAMHALDYSSSDGSPTAGMPANNSQLARNFRAKADALGHSRARPARILGGGAPSVSAHYGAPSASATPVSNAAIKPKVPKSRAATIASLAGDSDSDCSLEEIGIGTPASKGAIGSGSDFDDF